MNGALLLLLALPSAALEQFTLDNGLRVILAKDSTVPVAAVASIWRVGGRQETPGRSGFAHLFEHLMFEGSKQVPKGGFDRILETYGGDNNASTHQDFTFYHEVVPSNAVPVALWLDADRFGWPNISQEAVKTQIEVVKEERRMRVDNEPYGPLLYVEMTSRTFSNWQNAHPTIGSFEDLDAATLKDVKSFFEAYYAPANGILAVVGDFDLAQTRRHIEELFGPIGKGAKRPEVDLSEPAPAGERVESLKDAHAQLPALAVTWKGMPARGSDEQRALGLLGRALLEGKSARLYQSLVKESQVAVDVSGGLGFPASDLDEYQAPGAFGLFTTLKAEAGLDAARKLIVEETAKVAREGLTAAELARVKTKARAEKLRGRETSLGRAEELLYAALLDGDPAAADDLEKTMAVTGEQIKAAAALLKPEAATWFELRPEAKP